MIDIATAAAAPMLLASVGVLVEMILNDMHEWGNIHKHQYTAGPVLSDEIWEAAERSRWDALFADTKVGRIKDDMTNNPHRIRGSL